MFLQEMRMKIENYYDDLIRSGLEFNGRGFFILLVTVHVWFPLVASQCFLSAYRSSMKITTNPHITVTNRQIKV